MNEIAGALLQLSEEQLDVSMRPYITKLSDPPKAIELLEVVDYCIHGSLASGFVIRTLQALLDIALMSEEITLKELTPLATWRERLSPSLLERVEPQEVLTPEQVEARLTPIGRLRGVLPFIKAAIRMVGRKGGGLLKPEFAIVGKAADGGGKVIASFDAAGFIADLEALIGPVEEISDADADADAAADEVLAKLGL